MRKGSNTAPAAGNLSMPLRVVGDYLDRQKARTFSISWSIYSVTARYETIDGDQNEESFTLQNLYDRGVQMYFRRSNRFTAQPA